MWLPVYILLLCATLCQGLLSEDLIRMDGKYPSITYQTAVCCCCHTFMSMYVATCARGDTPF